MKSYFITFISLCILSLFSLNKLYSQNNKYTLEKIYIQTDRSLFFPGETIWFKAYVVEGNNTITEKSEVMYAQLISPDGSQIKELKMVISQGYAYGSIDIDKDWTGGVYKLLAYTNWMANFGEKSYFSKEVIIQKVIKPNLLLKLDFEKQGYGQSGMVKAKFEVKNLKNIPFKSDINYQVSISGIEYFSSTTQTSTTGKAEIIFELPENLNSRDVVLNVKIPYKGSFESISRNVPIVLESIDLQFLPESGKVLNNTLNRIAYRAVDEFGKPVDIGGNIYDSEEKKIGSFSSFHDGMGSFDLFAKPETRYYVKINEPFKSDARYYLQKAHDKGINFRLKTDSLSTKLKIHSTLKKPLQLIVYNSHNIIHEQIINSSKNILELKTKDFPIGITNFKITDETNKYIAERLAFINPHKKLYLDIKYDKEVYQTREEVNVSIKTTDKNGNPVPANLSLAVADNKLHTYADDKQDHILSSLLLSDELNGKIHEPYFYFNPKVEKSMEAIDYVMLTHGWRDYIRKEYSRKTLSYRAEFFGLRTGVVVDENNKPVQAKLLLFDNEGKKVLDFKTNKEGKYYFKQKEDKPLTLIAYTDDGRKLSIEKNYSFINSSLKLNTKTDSFLNTKKFETFKNYSKEQPQNDVDVNTGEVSVSLGANLESLDEVVVVGYDEILRASSSVMITKIQNSRIKNQSLSDILQGRVTGIRVANSISSDPNSSVYIRSNSSSGNNRPLVVIDGRAYEYDMLINHDLELFDSIVVLKASAATALYGTAGSNGVIVLSTKSGFRNFDKKTLFQQKFNNYAIKNYYDPPKKGFHFSRLFYTPKYNPKEQIEERTDFRQTIYWNPVVQTDSKGEAKLNFYTSDAITSFKITAEGLGYNGLIGRQEETFATKKLLSIDVKLPKYMALNDTINIPVTLTNESTSRVDGVFEIEYPEAVKLLSPSPKNVSIDPSNSIYFTLKIIPVKKINDTVIKFAINSQKLKDKIERPISVISPYFPMEQSISGTQSATHDFYIKNVLEGSLKAEFNIYIDIIGDVMDGIDGMISRPYGCFEQVSSVTYPNILILKYLKETNKNYQEVEKKAMAYIIDGYNKMIAYETSKDGFEWYGRNPPHVALTAYGLIQFIEMREIYTGVDKEMVRRTVSFLLNRRDGDGGFIQNRGKYGFSGFRKSVNNAYIVYAMSEAGVKDEISEEYRKAFNEAQNSNDSYRLALMALASYNFGYMDQFDKLISQLKLLIKEYEFEELPVENTLTNSYGNSKKIETSALVLLALLKEKTQDEFLIAQGIQFLTNKRKHGRFGSTQATALALKALVEYTKNQKQKLLSSKDFVSVKLNNKKLVTSLDKNELIEGKLFIDNLDKYIIDGSNILDVEFNEPDKTFNYALNITYDSFLPESEGDKYLNLNTNIAKKNYTIGDNISMNIDITNLKKNELGMVTAVIGIPAGTSSQIWQLKKMVEEQDVSFYETFDNYLVFYWLKFDGNETKSMRLDLKAEIPGIYQAPASAVYPYYGDENKTWEIGNKVIIK